MLCRRFAFANASAAPGASAASCERSVSIRRKFRRYSSIVKTESDQAVASAHRNIDAHFSTPSRTQPPPHVQNHSGFAPLSCENATSPSTRNIAPCRYERWVSSSVARLMSLNCTTTGNTTMSAMTTMPDRVHDSIIALKYANGTLHA